MYVLVPERPRRCLATEVNGAEDVGSRRQPYWKVVFHAKTGSRAESRAAYGVRTVRTTNRTSAAARLPKAPKLKGHRIRGRLLCSSE